MWRSIGSVFLLSLFLLPSFQGTAEAADRDSEVQAWTDAAATLELSKKWDVTGSVSLRTAPPMMDELNTDLSVDYRLAKWLGLGATYRLGIDEFDEESKRLKHRFAIDGTVYEKIGDLKLRFRHRQTLRLNTARSNGKHLIRWRIKAAMRTGTIAEPYISLEPHLLANLDEAVGIDKLRFTGGVKLDVGAGDVNLYYRLDQPMLDEKDERIHIVGLAFDIGVKLGD